MSLHSVNKQICCWKALGALSMQKHKERTLQLTVTL